MASLRHLTKYQKQDFFTFDTLPVIRKDQLILIEKIIRERNEETMGDVS